MTSRDDDAGMGPTPSRLPAEGRCAGMRCPQCGAGSVDCVSAVYEFSKLVCTRCGHTEMVDDWQIDEWFAPGQGTGPRTGGPRRR